MGKINQLTGSTLGQYELKNLLGKGGMGAVYRAYQPSLGRDVAVKVLSGEFLEDDHFVQRFTQEAKISASLEHPAIITVHDYGVENGMSYVVMRLLNGGTLEERLTQKGKIAPKEALRLLTPLADALDYAHKQGVLHRDIKPSNIMFDDQNRPYLVDFGLAKLANQSFSLTASGFMLGTPNYMSPEQWKGETLSPASDQYAFATMTYEILTGKMPFDADSTYALMHKHLHEAPPESTDTHKISKPIYSVIVRGMAKNPADRYPSLKAFMKALISAIEGGATISDGQATATPKADLSQPTVPFIIPPKKKSNWRRWVFGALFLVLIGLMGIVLLIFMFPIIDRNDSTLPTRIIVEDNTPTPTIAPTEAIRNSIALASARRAVENKNFRFALSSYNRIIEDNPNIAQLHYERAIVYYNLNQNNNALDDVNEAIRINPNLAPPYLLRARIYGDERNFGDALSSLNQYLALEASPVPEALEAKGTLEAIVTP
ncbi:MAG: protein kinase [bacterium]|nr:protein kinase [bacterium]